MFSSWSCTPVVHNGIWCTQWNMVYTILLFFRNNEQIFLKVNSILITFMVSF